MAFPRKVLTSARYKALFTPIVLGYAVFAVLLLFSVLFYMERSCYLDIAFQIFLMANTKEMGYQLGRFGAALVQVFPLIMVLLELPLKYVLLSYSVALVLENIFFYWLLHKVLKQQEIAIILVLFNLLLVTESFYWAGSEIKQGLSLCILFSGVALAIPVERYTAWRKGAVLILYALLLVTALFLHPLVIFATAFILGYSALQSGKIFSQTLMCSAAIIVITLLLKHFFLPVSQYDAERIGLWRNAINYFPDYFSIPSFGKFAGYCVKDWYLYSCMVIAVSGFFACRKQWLKMVWMLVFTGGFIFLVNVTQPHSPKWYVESHFVTLSIFVLYPFVLEVLAIAKAWQMMVILTVIFFLRLNTIYVTHEKYARRLDMMRELLAAYDGKFVIPTEYYPVNMETDTWGIGYESILLSSINSPDSCRSFAALDLKTTEIPANDSSVFLAYFGPIPYESLSTYYFRPAPGSYRILSEQEISKLNLINP